MHNAHPKYYIQYFTWFCLSVVAWRWLSEHKILANSREEKNSRSDVSLFNVFMKGPGKMFDQKWGRKSRDTVPWRNVLKFRPQRVCVLIFSTFIFFTIELTHYVLDSLIKNRFSEGNNLARSFELEGRQFWLLGVHDTNSNAVQYL